MQARLTHRFSNGLEWTSAYAWQKSMGWVSNSVNDSSLGFYIDLRRNYSQSSYNSAQTYAQSFVYELPFGKDKPLLHNGLMSKAAEGWQLATIMHIQTGTPLTFTANANQLNVPGTSQVANQVKPFRKLHGIGTSQYWFDPSSFVQPVGLALGNTGENIYSGPGLFTLDASAFRTFPIHESVTLQLRADAFNVLNHPVFGNPGSSLTSTNFGRVTSTAGTGVNGTAGAPRALQFAGTLRF